MLKSDIDLTSILKTTEEDSNEPNIENETQCMASKQTESIANNKNTSTESKANESEAEGEKNELIKKLEDSSKGTIKGSLIVNYFKASKRPFSLLFLMLSFLLTQILAGSADIFVSYW